MATSGSQHLDIEITIPFEDKRRIARSTFRAAPGEARDGETPAALCPTVERTSCLLIAANVLVQSAPVVSTAEPIKVAVLPTVTLIAFVPEIFPVILSGDENMASKSVAELRAQLERTQAELEAAIAAESEAVLADIREKVALYGFTEKDVFGRRRAVSPVEAKYQNPETGETWTGRGRAPAWIKDAKNRDKFLIN